LFRTFVAAVQKITFAIYFEPRHPREYNTRSCPQRLSFSDSDYYASTIQASSTAQGRHTHRSQPTPFSL